MKTYFELQFRWMYRKMLERGFEPLLAIPIILIGFVFTSIQLFQKTTYASILYLLILGMLLQINSDEKKNDFQKYIYSRIKYIQIRLSENLLIALPFILFLCSKSLILESFFAIIIVFIMVFSRQMNYFEMVIPTPFSKKPFEFSSGFRKNFGVYILAYFLSIMSVINNNLNLGLFGLILVFMSGIKYFQEPENELLVWNFSLSPKQFIQYKWKLILYAKSVLALPILLILSITFREQIFIIIGIHLLGCIIIFGTMLVKYANYPQTIDIKFAIILSFVIWLPFLLILVVPYFYVEANKNLKQLLDDRNK